ncbi:MAG: M16 family metallopeptidase [Bacteroidia bacterium]
MAYTLIEKVVEKQGEVNIPYHKYELSNGLSVIIHQDHSTPLVHVDVTYHVGSGREEIGKSGFAHFFEHMMFEGSKHVGNNKHFKYISEAGGTLNGSTNRDRTNYYETLPKNQLELALWLESDRMGFLLDAVTQEGFENQLSVIKNEKSQRYENQPYGMLSQTTQENFYPLNHPYSWTTIGYTEDLDRVTLNDLKEFFATWYGPNNAVLTIGGDVEIEETLKQVEKYFGSIPRGPEVQKPTFNDFTIDKTRYVSYKDQVRFPMLQITLPTVKVYHKDEPALDILADILGNGKNALLYKAFVKTQKAVQVFASNYCYEGSGEFRLGVLAYPNQSLAQIEKEIHEILANLAIEKINTEDVERTRVKYYSQILYSFESVKNKVSRLAAYHTFAPKTNYANIDVNRYKNVQVSDVENVFEKYILNQASLNVTFYGNEHEHLLPAADNHSFKRVGLDQIRHAKGNVLAPIIKDSINRNIKPKGGEVPTVQFPDLFELNYQNGVKLMGAHNAKSPTISMTFNFSAGSITDPKGQCGRSSLYAKMFKESTQTLSAEDVSKKLESLGSSISASNSKEHFTISVKSLKANAAKTVEIVKELLSRSTFNIEEYNRNLNEHKEYLAYQKDEVDIIANRAFYKAIYGQGHVMGNSTSGNIEDAENITIESLLQYKHNYLNPDNCKVVVSGAIDKDYAQELFGFINSWSGVSAKAVTVPTPNFSVAGKIIIKHKASAPQSEIRIGYPAMPFDADAEFYKASIMNYPLGAAFNSRINLNLREDKGYTYGARSYFSGGKFQGPFVASAAVAANVTANAVKEFLFEIENYCKNGITEQELEFTQKSLLYRDALKYETNGQKNQLMLKMLDFNLDKEYVETQKQLLANIATSEINSLAQKWLNINKMVVVIAGDKDIISKPLEELGFGEVIILEENTINV